MNVFSEFGFLSVIQGMIDNDVMMTIRLFQNDHNPASTDTEADYVEADFGGYSGSQELAWGIPFVNGSGNGEVNAAQVEWNCDGTGSDNLIYGVYVTDGDDNLTYAERFDAPQTMAEAGDAIRYAAKVTDTNQ